MQYLMIASVDWADEFDVHFAELISEDVYIRYKYLQDTLKTFQCYYGFGTNEYFEDLDYLGFTFNPIPDEDVEVLRKYKAINGRGIIDELFYYLREKYIDNFPEDCTIKKTRYGEITELEDDLLKCPFDKFKQYVDKFAKQRN